MLPYLRRHVGETQIAIGILHTTLGLLKYRRPLGAIARQRGLDPATDPPERQAAFWFVTCGLATIAAGQTIRWAQRRTGTVPASLGRSSLAIGLLGGLLIPKSGFWAIALHGLLALAASREK